jgi:hypothetical protein
LQTALWRLVHRAFGEQPENDTEGDQAHDTVLTQVIDEGDDVADHVAEERHLRAGEQRQDDAESQQHQRNFRQRTDPAFQGIQPIHERFSPDSVFSDLKLLNLDIHGKLGTTLGIDFP